MSPPVIRAVKKFAAYDHLTIIDCPPGTSCPMVTAVSDSDFVLLVTEPTPFGLHDLVLVVETVRTLGLPFGVGVNRSDAGDDRVVNYCRDEHIPVMISIPENRMIAEAYSNGTDLTRAVPELIPVFQDLISRIENKVMGVMV
jgi:MinD superfamily P-loop ATPase